MVFLVVGSMTSVASAQSLSGTYNELRVAVKAKFSDSAPGRKITTEGVRFRWISDDGQRRHWATRPARNAEVARSIRTFRRWLAPPVAHVGKNDAAPTSAAKAQPHVAGGRWSIPSYIVQCESGGNYRALNPSGAGGAYQIMPGTWSAYGGSNVAPQNASPAEQDAVAARIYRAQGAAPWVCG